MPSKEEKARRKVLMDQVAHRQRSAAEARLPLAKDMLKALFDYVDAKLETEGCDHTLRHSLSFMHQNSLPQRTVVPWLQEYGGFCDCEVIANVEEAWGDVIGSI